MPSNPYRPNSMVTPGMFAGRYIELKKIEDGLLQTTNGNPQHFLIEGERGIGKSSLFLFLEALSTGQLDGITTTGRYNFVCVSVDIGNCKCQLDIIQRIGKRFTRALKKNRNIKETSLAFWEWLTNWEVLGVKFKRENPEYSADEAIQELVEKISDFIEDEEDIEGVVILLDEADSPPASADLGKCLKYFCERLEREGCEKVSIGLAGLPGLTSIIKSSHQSSPRLFEIITLETLKIVERETAINAGLEIANMKSGTDITIDDDAMDYLCRLSEGYPHFLQQFAYCAFDANDDEVIDMGDVMHGAVGEDGAINQLGKMFFHEMYNAMITSDDYRKVLDVIAIYGDQWVKKGVLVNRCELPEHTVSNALSALRTKNIIDYDESRKGFYRLPTKSFAVWIKANKKQELELSEIDRKMQKGEEEWDEEWLDDL